MIYKINYPEYFLEYLDIPFHQRSLQKWGASITEGDRQGNFTLSLYCLCSRGWGSSFLIFSSYLDQAPVSWDSCCQKVPHRFSGCDPSVSQPWHKDRPTLSLTNRSTDLQSKIMTELLVGWTFFGLAIITCTLLQKGYFGKNITLYFQFGQFNHRQQPYIWPVYTFSSRLCNIQTIVIDFE